jgi:hypothetical protein
MRQIKRADIELGGRCLWKKILIHFTNLLYRKLYVELWGTMLRVYRAAPSKNKSNVDYRHNYRWPYYYYHKYYYTPIFTISLAGAEAGRALDYFKRPNALRLTTQQGPQLLLRLSSLVEMISWIEHLQAGKYIYMSLICNKN